MPSTTLLKQSDKLHLVLDVVAENFSFTWQGALQWSDCWLNEVAIVYKLRLMAGFIFCLKIFDTFTRTSVRVSKMNAVSHAQLTFQMLPLIKKNIYNARASLAREFGMDPKVRGSRPLRLTYFLSQNLRHFHKNIPLCATNSHSS